MFVCCCCFCLFLFFVFAVELYGGFDRFLPLLLNHYIGVGAVCLRGVGG